MIRFGDGNGSGGGWNDGWTAAGPGSPAASSRRAGASSERMSNLTDSPTAEAGSDVLVCGDFNVAPDDRDVWDAARCHGGTHVSGPEREALAHVSAFGLVDVLRQRFDHDELFSWWDYQAGAFHKHWGMRIDLLLATPSLAERLAWVLIDRNARKGEKPSDHAPLVAEFA